MTIPPVPVPVFALDVSGKNWLPALLLEIRNGVAVVQIGKYVTVRPLDDVCFREVPRSSGEGNQRGHGE